MMNDSIRRILDTDNEIGQPPVYPRNYRRPPISGSVANVQSVSAINKYAFFSLLHIVSRSAVLPGVIYARIGTGRTRNGRLHRQYKKPRD